MSSGAERLNTPPGHQLIDIIR